jgi:hypothetical protein
MKQLLPGNTRMEKGLGVDGPRVKQVNNALIFYSLTVMLWSRLFVNTKIVVEGSGLRRTR